MGTHKTIEQRCVHAMQILQRVKHPEAGSHVQVQRGIADKSKINQHDFTVVLLQCNRGIHSHSSCARTTFGVHHGKNFGFTDVTSCFAARGGVPGQSFEQGVSTSRTIEEFASSGPHGCHD